MAIPLFLAYIFAGLILTEIASYLLHRFVFHGVFWSVHKSHHTSRHSRFELNDLFSLSFFLLAIGMIWSGLDAPFPDFSVGLGVGISVYGLLYFVIHDGLAHKRFRVVRTDSRIVKAIVRAHQRHHQTANKPGQEPYGLFLFPYRKFGKELHAGRKPDETKKAAPAD